MTTHTKLPWSLAGNYAILTRFGLLHDLYRPEYSVEQMDEVEANAALIVHRVNGWDEVRGALESLIDSLSPEAWEALPQYVQDNAMTALTRAKGV